MPDALAAPVMRGIEQELCSDCYAAWSQEALNNKTSISNREGGSLEKWEAMIEIRNRLVEIAWSGKGGRDSKLAREAINILDENFQEEMMCPIERKAVEEMNEKLKELDEMEERIKKALDLTN